MNESATIVWRSHPARERPVAALAVIGTIGVLSGLTALLMESPGWAVLPPVVLVAALWRFFVPTTYRIDSNGISARSPLSRRQLRWSEVRRFVHDDRGGLVSSRGRPSLFGGSREIHLLFSGHLDEVVNAIREHIAQRRTVEEAASCAG